MQVCFSDEIDVNKQDWVVGPFGVTAVDVDIALQEGLIEMQSEITAHAILKRDKHYFSINGEIANNFPQLWEKVKLYLTAFSTSYLLQSVSVG
jgi:hypothetical protein